jgi:hypothetical protein
MNLALYPSRVRSSDLLGGTRLLPNFIVGEIMPDPYSNALGACAVSHFHQYSMLNGSETTFGHYKVVNNDRWSREERIAIADLRHGSPQYRLGQEKLAYEQALSRERL